MLLLTMDVVQPQSYDHAIHLDVQIRGPTWLMSVMDNKSSARVKALLSSHTQ